ncbi:hypothetical protein [Aeromonas salmonicida]|uniref:hypothetical protein n=1 Tax=Aeromonas salmonicida TaxID=645 RepID=UPI00232C7C47|nr:hypothetical protein [Aeromonas salmonicida]WCH25221.1 hypothetical protein ONZ54_22875 [Aeromonas salmonicida]
MEKAINEVLEQIKGACSGYDDRTAERVSSFAGKFTAEYAEVLGLSQLDVLVAVEKARSYSAANYYQESTFPHLSEVSVFDTRQDFLALIPSRQFRCPSCNGVSTDSERCNSGLKMSNDETCNWASFGFFKTLGKGLRVVVKESFLNEPRIYEIFMPLELEKQEEPAQ